MTERPTIKLRDTTQPKPTPICTYGGTCEEPAVMVYDRIDETGSRTSLACKEHDAAVRDHTARYVHGWGQVTLIVYPVEG